MKDLEEILNSIDNKEKETRQNVLINYIINWHWFLIFCSIGLVVGFVGFQLTPATFEVKSRLLIPSDGNSFTDIKPFNNPGSSQKQTIENQIGILKSYTLYKRAIENLNWETSFYVKNKFSLVELYESKPFEIVISQETKNLKGILLEIRVIDSNSFEIEGDSYVYPDGVKQELKFSSKCEFGKPFKNEYFDFTLSRNNCKSGETYYLEFNDFNSMAQGYLNAVKIDLEAKQSEIISVSLRGQNPQKNADFINELNKVFIKYGINNKNLLTENSLNFIDTSLVGISNSLKRAESNLSNFRKDNKVIDPSSEAKVIYEKLEIIENEKYQAKIRLDYYKNLQEYLGDAAKIKQMINPSIIGITDPGLTSLLPKLADLYSKREVLSFSVEANNPNLILLEKEIQLATNSLSETLKNLITNAEIEMQNMEDRYKSVQDRLNTLPETERNLISIQREFNLNNELYTYMMQKKAETSIVLASNIPQVQIIDAAMVEAKVKTGPNLFIFLFGGFGLGFMIPFMVIFISDLFNTKLETTEDVEGLTHVQILDGIIHSNYKNSLPVFNYPQSGITESFRLLKVNLRNFLRDPDKRIISVNSLVSGEGKSFISSNLAAVLSLSTTPKKVLLVEGDLRRPMLNKTFGTNQGIGLSSFLLQEKEFSEIIIETSNSNLYFVPAGEIQPNPTELLENGRFKKFIELARKEFDYIIVDNAPISLVPDGIMTSKFADVNLFVLRLNYSKKKEVKEINRTIELNSIGHALIVINDSPKNRFGYGNKYWKNGYGTYVNPTKSA